MPPHRERLVLGHRRELRSPSNTEPDVGRSSPPNRFSSVVLTGTGPPPHHQQLPGAHLHVHVRNGVHSPDGVGNTPCQAAPGQGRAPRVLLPVGPDAGVVGFEREADPVLSSGPSRSPVAAACPHPVEDGELLGDVAFLPVLVVSRRRSTSVGVRPSRIWTVRRTCSDTAGSCVTISTVTPSSRFTARSVSSTSALVASSSSPVGSSASRHPWCVRPRRRSPPLRLAPDMWPGAGRGSAPPGAAPAARPPAPRDPCRPAPSACHVSRR